MTLHIYPELEQGSDEWVAARCGKLTASQIGKLITATGKVADNDTSRGLAITLAAERITGHVEYIYPSHDMQRGTEEEPLARAVYEEHHAPVVEVGFITREFDGFTLGYSPDGLVGDDGLIEIKSRKANVHIKTILSGVPPTENLAQLYTGLLVTGREWIDYCSFSAGFPFWTTRIYADSAWFDLLTRAAQSLETNVADIIAHYTKETNGLPMAERRPDLSEITF